MKILLLQKQLQQNVVIPRIKLAPSDINLPFILEHCQFPVRLAYSMTINKAKGQTFNKVGIGLPIPLFSHDQLAICCIVRSKII